MQNVLHEHKDELASPIRSRETQLKLTQWSVLKYRIHLLGLWRTTLAPAFLRERSAFRVSGWPPATGSTKIDSWIRWRCTRTQNIEDFSPLNTLLAWLIIGTHLSLTPHLRHGSPYQQVSYRRHSSEDHGDTQALSPSQDVHPRQGTLGKHCRKTGKLVPT